MKKLHTLGLATGLLLAASVAFASSTFNGQTGNVTLPTAAVTPYGVLVVTADYQNTRDIINTEADSGALFVRCGIIKDVEVGVGYRVFSFDRPIAATAGGRVLRVTKSAALSSSNKADTYNIAAKYQSPIHLLGIDWSASAEYGVTNKFDIFQDDIKTTQIAWVGDRKFMVLDREIVGTVGVNWTEQDLGSRGKPHAIRYFAGASVPVVDNLTAMADYQTASDNLDSKSMYGVALCYQADKDIEIKAGVSSAYPSGEVNGAGQAKPFVAVSMQFNGMK